jgi:hypothetical protein
VPLNARTTSFAPVSRKIVAWVSVLVSSKVLTISVPKGGFAQSSWYAAAEKAVYRVILSNILDDTVTTAAV